MKIRMSLKIGVYVLISMVLASCAGQGVTPSQFGTGKYHCYYQNIRTGIFYRGASENEVAAIRATKKQCTASAANEQDEVNCQFDECRFK